MLNQIFLPSYWFTFNPALVDGIIGNCVFGFFVLLFVLGIVTRIVASQRALDRYLQKVVTQSVTLLITMGLLGVALYFFSFERIRFFGARFWYLLWLVGLVFWVYRIVRHVKDEIPAARQRAHEQKEKQKYFPSKKK